MFVQNNERKCLKVEISLTTGYRFGLSPEIVTQWIIMLILAVSGFLLTRNLKTVPDKKQAALEKLYITVESLVKNTMGESYTNFTVSYTHLISRIDQYLKFCSCV